MDSTKTLSLGMLHIVIIYLSPKFLDFINKNNAVLQVKNKQRSRFMTSKLHRESSVNQKRMKYETLSCALKSNISFVCIQFLVTLSISVTTTNLRKAHTKKKREKLKG